MENPIQEAPENYFKALKDTHKYCQREQNQKNTFRESTLLPHKLIGKGTNSQPNHAYQCQSDLDNKQQSPANRYYDNKGCYRSKGIEKEGNC